MGALTPADRNKRNLVLRIVAAVAGVALLALGLGVFKSCDSPDAAQISDQVQESMQRELDTNPSFASYGMRVVDVVVLNESDNKYNGVATIRTRGGKEHQVAVDVTADDDGVIWQTAPGAFLFAAQEAEAAPGGWG